LYQNNPDSVLAIYFYLNQIKENNLSNPSYLELYELTEVLKVYDKLEAQDSLKKYYVSSDSLNQALKNIAFVKNTYAQNSAIGQIIQKPITISFYTLGSDNKYGLVISSLDTNTEYVFYRINQKGDFIDTGSSDLNLPFKTTNRTPNNLVELVLEPGTAKLEVKYKDSKNRESRVFEFELKVDPNNFTNQVL
jgi:hypothetical protein